MSENSNLPHLDHNSGPPPEVPNHEVLKWIGGGSYGEVWLARSIMGVVRAVKVVRRAKFENDKPYDREFEGLRNFEPVSRKHDGFMDVLQVGRNDAEGYFFYVMEAADDEVMGQRIEPASYKPKTLQSEFASQGRLPFERCLKIGLSLADSLHHLQQHGLVHRDIKPSNIIFVNDLPKLADIGLVTSATSAATFIGAPGYIPPEGPGKPQGDIYALGKVLYEIVTGNDRLQFPKPPMDLADSDLNDFQELNEIILKACESDPRRRYVSAEKMHEDLVLLQGGKSVRRLRGLERKFKIAAYVAVVAVLLTLLLVGIEKMRSAVLRDKASAQERELAAQQLVSAALGEKASAQQGDLLTQQLVMMRLTPHSTGWSTNAWQKAAKAVEFGAKESRDKLRDQSAALLAGLDARRIVPFPSFGAASAVFDRKGSRLLVGSSGEGTKLWNRQTGELQILSQTNSGPLAFANDAPVELRYDPKRHSLALDDLRDSRVRQEWRLPTRLGTTEVETNAPALMALAPNAATVAVVLELADGKQTMIVSQSNSFRELEAPSPPISKLALSPDGSLVAATHSKNRIGVWSVSDGRLVAELATDRNEVLCMAFKQTTRVSENPEKGAVWLLAAGDSGGSVTLWDLQTQIAKAHYRGGHYGVSRVTFNPDGTILASGGRGPVKLWDVATEKLLLDVTVAGSGEDVAGLDFAPDGKQLALSMKGGMTHPEHVLVWELEFGRGIQTLHGLSGEISKVCFSADGKQVAALSHDWEVGVWNLVSGALLRVFEVPTGDYADNAALSFDPTGQRLAFAASRKARMWNIESGAELKSWELLPGLVDVMVFPDENHLLLGRVETFDGKRPPYGGVRDPKVYRIRNLLAPDWRRPVAEDPDFNGRISGHVAAPDGRFFVVEGEHLNATGRRTLIKAYDGFTGRELWTFPSTRTNASGITIAATGQFVAFHTDDTTNAVQVDVTTGSAIKLLPWLSLLPTTAPEGGYYAVRGHVLGLERGLSLCQVTSLSPVITLGIDGEVIVNPQFDRTGNRLVWGNADGTVTVCDLKEVRNRLAPLGLAW